MSLAGPTVRYKASAGLYNPLLIVYSFLLLRTNLTIKNFS
ncbi:hypothetical protein JPSP19_26860 [Staphylococcus pseudintermedius]